MSKQVEKGPPADESKEGLKVKKKVGRPRKLVKKDEPIKLDLTKKEEEPAKVDLTKKEENAIPVGETKEVPVGERAADSGSVEQGVRVDATNNDTQKEEVQKPQIEEIEKPIEEVKQEKVIETIADPRTQQKEERLLPENIEKLVSFMEETGGTIEDYARLNRDYSNVDESVLLREYYKTTKPHLNAEEIDFILEDNFSWDEEADEDRYIKKKQLAYKEEIAKARKFLDDSKNKYYDEIKLRPSVTQEQKKATEFFNKYNEEQQRAENNHKDFVNKTNQLFNNFEGFNFDVGEKRFRYKINNVDEVAKQQSNLNNFVGRFLNEDGSIKDPDAYHKAIYAAKNADHIAEHFYEQGKADAIREVNAKSKNINMDPSPQSEGDVFVNGFKVRAISGVDSSKLKFKTRKNKN